MINALREWELWAMGGAAIVVALILAAFVQQLFRRQEFTADRRREEADRGRRPQPIIRSVPRRSAPDWKTAPTERHRISVTPAPADTSITATRPPITVTRREPSGWAEEALAKLIREVDQPPVPAAPPARHRSETAAPAPAPARGWAQVALAQVVAEAAAEQRPIVQDELGAWAPWEHEKTEPLLLLDLMRGRENPFITAGRELDDTAFRIDRMRASLIVAAASPYNRDSTARAGRELDAAQLELDRLRAALNERITQDA